jgi:arsenite oxidase small subunit
MNINRRRFLTSASAITVGSTLPIPAEAAGSITLAALASLTPGQPLDTQLADGTPAIVLKLGKACAGGVGPDRDIVGFVPICTHLGCTVAWKSGRFACPCHASQFDPTLRGQCYQGPATTGLPRLRLDMNGSDIVCSGVDGIVWTFPTVEHA